MKKIFTLSLLLFFLSSLHAQKCMRTLEGHTGFITSLCVFQDGRTIISSSTDKSIRKWDVANGTNLFRNEVHKTPVYSMSLSPDGRMFATGGWDFSVKIWDALTGNLLREFPGIFTSKITALSFSADNSRIAVASGDSVKVADVISGTLQAWKAHTDDVSSIAFSPDGKILATASSDMSISLWESQGFKKKKTMRTRPARLKKLFSPPTANISSVFPAIAGSGSGMQKTPSCYQR